MIVYQLVCEHDHTFDSWFRDSVAYDALAAAGEVACPLCGSHRVGKALMAPRLARRKGQDGPAAPPPEAAAAPPVAAAPAPAVPGPAAAVLPPAPEDRRMSAQTAAQLALLLRAVRHHVEQTCDYVGDTFADEARKIHYGEADQRGIYGETTPEEVEDLREEGIAVASIPWVRDNG